ncbi:hypothetical protein ABT061_08490 [Streptosporangium sp. NPDC002544]|uniref:hypothetical protein n=1 Tax=Streptosporangium sp. NPDC002544 TaxID=3154538 RepID=UPI00331A7626
MDSQDSPLYKAARLQLVGARAEEVTVSAVHIMECLEDDDWETALILLEDLGDAHPQPPKLPIGMAEIRAANAVWVYRPSGVQIPEPPQFRGPLPDFGRGPF